MSGESAVPRHYSFNRKRARLSRGGGGWMPVAVLPESGRPSPPTLSEPIPRRIKVRWREQEEKAIKARELFLVCGDR